jgi:hypothetical protein
MVTIHREKLRYVELKMLAPISKPNDVNNTKQEIVIRGIKKNNL